MKRFKQMLKVARQHGVQCKQTGQNVTDMFLAAAEKCEVFVFSVPKKLGPEDVQEIPGEGEVLHIDPPFEVFSIEMDDGVPITSPRPGGPEVYVEGLMVEELGPSRHRYYIYATVYSRPSVPNLRDIEDPVEQMIALNNAVKSAQNVRKEERVFMTSEESEGSPLVRVYLDRLNREACGVQIARSQTVFKKAGRKRKIIKDRVFIVAPKHHRERREYRERKVDWSHRFSVRGHWVHFWIDKAKGLLDFTRVGKNRQGERCVHGVTWRRAHERGPDDKPLIKKQRVVAEDDE